MPILRLFTCQFLQGPRCYPYRRTCFSAKRSSADPIPNLKAFAQKTFPTSQEHFQLIRKIATGQGSMNGHSSK